MTIEQIKIELKKMAPEFAAKIAPVYQTLQWQWSPGKSELHIPTVSEIENKLYSLIESLGLPKYHEAGAGGLKAYYCLPDQDEPGYYGLGFECNDERTFD